MKKMTWEEVKGKGKQFYRDHKDGIIFVGGIVFGVSGYLVKSSMYEKDHQPKTVDIRFDPSNGECLTIRAWNVDKYGNRTYATGLSLKPAAAIHTARDILYYLAGEAK